MKLNIKSIRTKIIFASIISIIPLILLVLFNYSWMRDQKIKEINNNYMADIAHVTDKLSQFKHSFVSDARFLTRIPSVSGLIRAFNNGGVDPRDDYPSEKYWKKRMGQVFSGMIETNLSYDQISFIDKNGMELVRVSLKKGHCVVTPEKKRQNKQDRYYFTETSKLHADEVYFSNIDLNQEEGKIEIPHKLILRVSTPVFDASGNFDGIIVMNIAIQKVFNNVLNARLSESISAYHFIADETGSYLQLGINPEKKWGGKNDLNTQEGLKKDFPDNYSKIMSGGIVTLDRNGENRVIFSSPIFLWTSKNKYLIIGEDISLNIAMKEINSFSFVLLCLVALSLFISIAISIYSSHKATSSISNLSNTVIKFKNGEWTARVTDPPTDEIGQIARVFNEVADDMLRYKRESQGKLNFLSKAIEQSPLSVVITDTNGKIQYVNHYFSEITGYRAEETIGEDIRILNFQNPEDYKKILDTVTSGSVWQGELLSKNKSGNGYYESVSIAPVQDEAGKISNLVVVKENITDRKQVEKRLFEESERIKFLLELYDKSLYLTEKELYSYTLEKAVSITGSTNGFIHLVTEDQQRVILVAWNQAIIKNWEYMYGLHYSVEDAGLWADCVMVQKPVIYNDLLNTPDKKGYTEGHIPIQRFMEIPVLMMGKVRLILGLGNKPENYEQDDILNAQLIANEIHKVILQRQTEKSIRKFSRAMEQNPVSVVITDPEGTIEYVNPKFLKVTGYTKEEVLGQNLRIFNENEQSGEFDKTTWNSILDGNEWHGTLSNKNKNDELYWLKASISPMRDEKGEILHIIELKEDITEQKQLEEALWKAKEAAEAANRAKSTFLANMSHEIRTPMNAILGFTQLMLRDPSTNQQQKERLNIINRSGGHLLALINDILEISKIEAGHIKVNLAMLDLHALLNDLEVMFKVRTDSKDLRLLFELADDLPRYIVTDEGKLRQILINLIGNAVKFTQEGGIAVRVKSEQNTEGKLNLMVEIEDSGPGIAKEDMSKLFKTFEQTASGLKEGGSGLGLAISRQFVRLIGGKISVKSELSKGSCFFMTLEIQKSDVSEIKESLIQRRVTGIQPGQETYRILIVDDKIDNIQYLKEILSPIGFEIKEAFDGIQAISFFEQWHPQLILMDMRMPVMNGDEATKRIKATEGPLPYIIIVTATAFDEDIKEIMASGADEYIKKPFKENEIFEAIEKALGVKYVYSKDESLTKETQDRLKAQDLVVLPDERIRQMKESIINAQLDRLLDLIDESTELSPQITAQLRTMANEFQYDTLLKLLKRTDR